MTIAAGNYLAPLQNLCYGFLCNTQSVFLFVYYIYWENTAHETAFLCFTTHIGKMYYTQRKQILCVHFHDMYPVFQMLILSMG